MAQRAGWAGLGWPAWLVWPRRKCTRPPSKWLFRPSQRGGHFTAMVPPGLASLAGLAEPRPKAQLHKTSPRTQNQIINAQTRQKLNQEDSLRKNLGWRPSFITQVQEPIINSSAFRPNRNSTKKIHYEKSWAEGPASQDKSKNL